MEKGFAGRIAEFFINSKLTILLMIALMIIGVVQFHINTKRRRTADYYPDGGCNGGLSGS
jgi:hypothetical protein